VRGRQGIGWVRERFDVERSVDLHLDLYTRLLAQRAGARAGSRRRTAIA
jgi:hypothetical protein